MTYFWNSGIGVKCGFVDVAAVVCSSGSVQDAVVPIEKNEAPMKADTQYGFQALPALPVRALGG